MMVFFGLMFYKVAAGLCLYFIASSLWGLAERKLFLPKRQPPGAAIVSTAGRPDAGPKVGRRKPQPAKANGDGIFQKVQDMWAEVLKEARKK
jgi:YidC/Oxa1 family membrane protein insertase